MMDQLSIYYGPIMMAGQVVPNSFMQLLRCGHRVFGSTSHAETSIAVHQKVGSKGMGIVECARA